ncbi:YybH family protein [Spirosoma arcticum]
MKTLFIVLVLSATALLTTTVRAQSARTAPGDRDEKRSDRSAGAASAIRKTFDDSRAAFDKRDLNAFVSYFVSSPDSYFQVSTADRQVILAHGIENIKKMVGGYMQSHPSAAPAGSFKTSDLRVRVHGNVAFMTGNSLDSTTNEHSQDFIILEKQGEAWKISALTAQYYETGKRIEVN